MYSEKGRKLRYFGLPSGDIIDFKHWNEFLGDQIIAIEYDENQLDLMNENISLSILENEDDEERKMFGTIPMNCIYGPYYADINDFILNIEKDIEKFCKDNYINIKFPFDIISLGYTQFFSAKHKEAFISLLKIHQKAYKKKKDPKTKDLLIFYSLSTQRGYKNDNEEVNRMMNDAKGWSIRQSNNALDIFTWLEKKGKIRDKLIVVLPYFILRESKRYGFNPEPLGIYLWQTQEKNNYFINVAFRLSHNENSKENPTDDELAKIPIKKVLLIKDGETIDYKTDMPEFIEKME